MKLWTIQTEAAWRSLNECGHLRCRRHQAEPDFLPAYDWMVSHMERWIGMPPVPGLMPIWAWYQYESAEQPAPDLQSPGLLWPGTCAYRIALDIDDEQTVLLSDFMLWHHVLSYCYLACSESDADEFHRLYESEETTVWSWLHPPDDVQLRQRINDSWNRVFDLTWAEPGMASPLPEKSIQATLWQLKLEDVIEADAFVAH